MTDVDRLDVTVLDVPLDEPESDGTLTWTSTVVVVVEARSSGVTGTGFTYGTAGCAAVVRDVLAEAVIGANAMDPPKAWRDMVISIRNLGRPGISSMAIAAVDCALWDLKARLLEMPLCRLLGMVHDRAAVYGSGGFTSMSSHELCAQLSGWVDEGIPRVKMKVGSAWGSLEARDVERVTEARSAVGDDVELYVDANGAYRTKQAVRLGRAYADRGVTWFEEPVSSDDLDGLAVVRAALDADVAAGEYGYDLAYFERMCDAAAVDVLQADVTRCAGITEWVRVAAIAAARNIEISAHCAPALHLHPACAIPNLRHLEYFADHVAVERLLFDGVQDPVGGALSPDLGRPGAGLDFKRSDAESFCVGSFSKRV